MFPLVKVRHQSNTQLYWNCPDAKRRTFSLCCKKRGGEKKNPNFYGYFWSRVRHMCDTPSVSPTRCAGLSGPGFKIGGEASFSDLTGPLASWGYLLPLLFSSIYMDIWLSHFCALWLLCICTIYQFRPGLTSGIKILCNNCDHSLSHVLLRKDYRPLTFF